MKSEFKKWRAGITVIAKWPQKEPSDSMFRAFKMKSKFKKIFNQKNEFSKLKIFSFQGDILFSKTRDFGWII